MPIHSIAPIYDANSKILILGSFPSVRSREVGFFYGHARNRFWPLIAELLQEALPPTPKEKAAMLLRHNIALWDVAASCEIEGSSDSSMRSVIPNDLSCILQSADIRAIYVNGRTAHTYYRRLLEPITGKTAILLPSTSPANASCSMQQLQASWSVILKNL